MSGCARVNYSGNMNPKSPYVVKQKAPTKNWSSTMTATLFLLLIIIPNFRPWDSCLTIHWTVDIPSYNNCLITDSSVFPLVSSRSMNVGIFKYSQLYVGFSIDNLTGLCETLSNFCNSCYTLIKSSIRHGANFAIMRKLNLRCSTMMGS